MSLTADQIVAAIKAAEPEVRAALRAALAEPEPVEAAPEIFPSLRTSPQGLIENHVKPALEYGTRGDVLSYLKEARLSILPSDLSGREAMIIARSVAHRGDHYGPHFPKSAWAPLVATAERQRSVEAKRASFGVINGGASDPDDGPEAA